MTRFITSFALSALTAVMTATPATAGTLNACVNRASGEIKIVAPGARCRAGSYAVQLSTGDSTPPVPTVEYVTGGIYPGTSVSRALCPPGTIVTGGGGITSGMGFALQQSHPISDLTGVIAWGPNAVGWQVAADDFSFSQAFVVCLRP